MLPKILAIVADWRGANDASYAYAFKKIGCSVKIINVDSTFKKLSYIERAYRKIFSTPFISRIEQFNQEIIRKIDEINPQVLFAAKGLWIKAETIKYAQSKGVITVHWHPDDAFNRENSSKILDASLSIYDLIVTPKSFNVNEYKEVGAKKVIYLPYSYDSSIHYPVKLSKDDYKIYGNDLTFVGAMREKRVNELEYVYNNDFNMKIWGTGWEKLSNNYSFKECCTCKPVYAEQMSKVFQSSLIVLGFLNAENRDLHTARTFEVPACKGFLLAERTVEHEEFFEEGKEAEFFSNLDELVEKCRYYTSKPNEAEKVALNGYNKVVKMNATYEDRAKQILAELDFV